MISTRARNKIKHWLNLHQRERAIEIGRKLVEREAKKYRLSVKSLDEAGMQKVAADYGFGRPDDLMAAIGYGKFSARSVLAKLLPTTPADAPAEKEDEDGGISSVVRRVFGSSADSAALKVRGHDDLLTYRARCCNPIRGEEIIGYVTRGKGVAVHSRSCRNVRNLMYESDRRIAVEWAKLAKEKDARQTYPIKLSIFCDDRFGMLKQITAVISDQQTNIRNIEAKTSNLQAEIDVVIDIEDVKHMDRIVANLRKISGIRDVQRVARA